YNFLNPPEAHREIGKGSPKGRNLVRFDTLRGDQGRGGTRPYRLVGAGWACELRRFQMSSKALAKSWGRSAIQRVTRSEANQSPQSISSGCSVKGPSASQR